VLAALLPFGVGCQGQLGSSDSSTSADITAPLNLTAQASSSSEVDLSWTSGSHRTVQFVIERAQSGEPFSQLATLSGSTIQYADTRAAAGTTYAYQIVAVGPSGGHAGSSIVSVTTPSDDQPTPPDMATAPDMTTPSDMTTALDMSGSPDLSGPGVRYVLEDFENGIRDLQPTDVTSQSRYQWGLYDGTGTVSISTFDKFQGLHSLNVFQAACATASCWQLQYYTYTEGIPGFNDDWHFIREFVQNPSQYQVNKVNRLRFWIKLPLGISGPTDGSHNFEFGTFIRCPTCSGHEDNNNHWYHAMSMSSSGAWHQVIIDTHPNHQRGGPGDYEWGDQTYVEGMVGYNYFDLMTNFYLDNGYAPVPTGNFYLDSFELYQETNDENTDQIYALNGGYGASNNTLSIGWNRNKNEDTVNHEVRYSFSDVFASGWGAATPAPNGVVTPPGTGGYNSMNYSTNQIDVSGRSAIYIAIKPQNSSRFRQIVIPIQ
jgi:hypothetical protein